MNVEHTHIEGAVIVTPNVFADERGQFLESYNKRDFSKIGIDDDFVQSNLSTSVCGTLRGFHLQSAPYAQSKLVTVTRGSVQDICVDLRAGSKTFGQYASVYLDHKSFKYFYIPEGCAHGFFAYEYTVFQYQCNNYYNKDSEVGIMWNDPDLAIDWDTKDQSWDTDVKIKPIISDKDNQNLSFQNFLKLS